MQARPITLSSLVLTGSLASGVAHAQEGAPANPLDPLLAESIEWYTGVAGSVDDERAADLLLRAAEDEDPLSVMWLARVHSRGRMGFEEDTAQARALAAGVIGQVRTFADQGLPEAQFLMGTAYAEALGVEQNDLEAMVWYLRAATSKHVLAQHNLGNVYFEGTGVAQSDSLAVLWWRQAAEQGDAIPALRLGTMYEQGRGVTADLDEARRWYEEAASRGNADAAQALERLGGRSPRPLELQATPLHPDGMDAEPEDGWRGDPPPTRIGVSHRSAPSARHGRVDRRPRRARGAVGRLNREWRGSPP